MHLANKTGDENKKAFMYKGNLSMLTGWDWGGWIFKTLIGSVYVPPPPKKTVQLYEHSNTAGKKITTRRPNN